MTKRHLLAFALIAMLPAMEALAGPDRGVYALQSRLQIEGYYDDEVDGLAGPNFRRAISDYAKDHGITSSQSAVYDHMVKRAWQQEAREPTERELEEAQKAARDRVKDGPAARFRDEVAFDVADAVVICGEINGKNSYGAYAGFAPYQAMVMQPDFDGIIEQAISEAEASGEPMPKEEIEKARTFMADYYLASAIIDSPFTPHMCNLGTTNLIPSELP